MIQDEKVKLFLKKKQKKVLTIEVFVMFESHIKDLPDRWTLKLLSY